MIDARMLTVGPLQENCYIVRETGSDRAVIVDPGAEAERLLEALPALGVGTVDAVLITHTHLDHIGAVAPVARATGAPVYCPRGEAEVLADIVAHIPEMFLRFGPFESWDAEHTLLGGETLELAGLRFEVLSTPGHSPAHVTYAVRDAADAASLFSGDVLFQGSVGRVDLPGADWGTLLASIELLTDSFPETAVVHPGHGPLTTLGRERATNPFLRELAR